MAESNPHTARPGRGGRLRLAGIGVGPSNLSLAALLHTSDDRERDIFFEARPQIAWHSGMMLPDAEMQVHFLKDLVTPVDPTNPYSFLAFLVGRGDFYRLLNSRRRHLTRREFESYCAWAASRLPTVNFDAEVLDVNWDNGFVLTTKIGTYQADNICVGVGVHPFLPPCARQLVSPRVVHSADFLFALPQPAPRRVAVVGGGQSGAEVVAHLQAHSSPSLEQILWVTRRRTYLPLDESPFTEDFFTPTASEDFYRQDPQTRRRLLDEQRMASDGVSDGLLERIYRRSYDIDNGFADGPSLRLTPATELVALRADPGQEVELDLRSVRDGEASRRTADFVVLATGYEQTLPPALSSLADRISFDADGVRVRPDFSVQWDGPEWNQIFLQNGARHVRGIADPNLSLVAWRAGIIATTIAPDLRRRLLDPHLREPQPGQPSHERG